MRPVAVRNVTGLQHPLAELSRNPLNTYFYVALRIPFCLVPGDPRGGYLAELLKKTEALTNPYQESGGEESEFFASLVVRFGPVCDAAVRSMARWRGFWASRNSYAVPTSYPQPKRLPLNCRLRILREQMGVFGLHGVAARTPSVYFFRAFGPTGVSVKALYLQGLSKRTGNSYGVVLKPDLLPQETLAAKAWTGLPNTCDCPGVSAA